uniref:Uncharacterized protein n=1 Tax=Megaselia scalaris TaxID=36166 RepID=T1H234_MEGSC
MRQKQYTTPVPILKQINRQNYDGSYSYGYEGADGSFKLEVKLPNGEVYGKYGYRDEQGQIREIKYGAGDRGFEPSGNDINVPPPTLSKDYLKSENTRKEKQQKFVIKPQVNYNQPQFDTRPQQFLNDQEPQQPQRQQYQAPQPQRQQYQLQQQPQYQPQQAQQYQQQPIQPIQQQYTNTYKQPA